MCSSALQLKSFYISHSSLKDRNLVITSGFASYSVLVMILVHLHPSLSELNFFVSFCFCIEAADTGTRWFSGSTAVPVDSV